jgi:hypothetical protein
VIVVDFLHYVISLNKIVIESCHLRFALTTEAYAALALQSNLLNTQFLVTLFLIIAHEISVFCQSLLCFASSDIAKATANASANPSTIKPAVLICGQSVNEAKAGVGVVEF